MNTEDMKKNLGGMFWEVKPDFTIPEAGSSQDAVHIFKKNIVPITWNSMSSLERNPSTLPQTETILKGQSVSGISISDMMQVKNYGDGAKLLVSMLTEGSFKLDEKTASALHQCVGREDALTWGKFRNSDITIGGVDYLPPNSKDLSAIAKNGFGYIEKYLESPKERAVATFLFMARSQFFHDANKRTASLMMNGHLMQNGVCPITVLNRDSEEFHTKLTDFYNTGNATKMMQFFERSVRDMYPGQDKNKTVEQAQEPARPEKKIKTAQGPER